MYLREATTNAVVALMQAHIASLTAILGSDETAYLVDADHGGPLTAAMVRRGSITRPWQLLATTNPQDGGALRVSVCSGNHNSGRSYSTARKVTQPTKYVNDLETTVYVIFHPTVFANEDTDEEERIRNLALDRVEDALRVILNDPVHELLVLASQESGVPDRLSPCYTPAGYQGRIKLAFADGVVTWGIYAVHTGRIRR